MKSTLLSALTIATCMSSSLAMAGLTPGQVEAEQQLSPHPPRRQGGLTPGQVEAENRNAAPAPQDPAAARAARLAEEAARKDREAMAREALRQARIAAQREFERLEAIRAAEAALARQQQEIAAEAARVEEERQALLRQGSASVAFSGVTRKTGGEWLRVSLARPMQLSGVEIAVLEAAAKFHQIIVHAENGQAFEIRTDAAMIVSPFMGAQLQDLRGIPNRIIAIDARIESMGAKSVISIEVNSLEGVPSLSKEKLSVK